MLTKAARKRAVKMEAYVLAQEREVGLITADEQRAKLTEIHQEYSWPFADKKPD